MLVNILQFMVVTDDGKHTMYALTENNKLWVKRLSGPDSEWKEIPNRGEPRV